MSLVTANETLDNLINEARQYGVPDQDVLLNLLFELKHDLEDASQE